MDEDFVSIKQRIEEKKKKQKEEEEAADPSAVDDADEDKFEIDAEDWDLKMR
jgi:hypothetical protein